MEIRKCRWLFWQIYDKVWRSRKVFEFGVSNIQVSVLDFLLAASLITSVFKSGTKFKPLEKATAYLKSPNFA